VNWYPRSKHSRARYDPYDDAAVLDQCKFEERHLAFIDMDAIWFELQRFKNERAWYT